MPDPTGRRTRTPIVLEQVHLIVDGSLGDALFALLSQIAYPPNLAVITRNAARSGIIRQDVVVPLLAKLLKALDSAECSEVRGMSVLAGNAA